MPAQLNKIRDRLKAFELRKLLIEDLGWDHHSAQPLVVKVGQDEFTLEAIAEKRGMVVFVHKAPGIPPYPTRKKIEQQARKSAHEHVVIFLDSSHTTQIWQWVKREPGGRSFTRSHAFHQGQSGQAMAERLQGLAFELDEEDALTLTDVTARTRSALDVEKITKRFYDRFKKEHQTFLKFIEGIEERTDRDWYASLMLNRMMFVYFIQKRGFLDSDRDYLRNRLRMVQQRRGKGHFLSFYRCFLLRLFHEGLGEPESSRSKDLEALLGHVPYLNGGLFDVHELEREYGEIDIPDKAFERIFDFFDSYTWHLDERPLRADNEINPDVLGYIFEKYINQKQMGAYYTKEDITGYITRNTVIPYLFDAARKECAIAFKAEGGVWGLLSEDPDRYIYHAVRSGVIDGEGNIVPEDTLPGFVQEGMHDPKERMFNKRYNLTQAVIPGPDGENLALPTETWREYVERRKRCLELHEKLAKGEVQAIDDFITLNLDIEQFAEDVITNSEGPELVRAFWKALTNISILDPTCGSGAFLFAALNILEPLYNACLDGMQGFLDDLETSSRKHSPKKLSNFREVLDEMDKHPNRRYFVLKTIVINNLYGVDIMDEAVEICKLRLFLKLVAQVESVKQIEPLPDIDFNIRAGNTLVGFTSLDAVRDAMTYEPDGQHRMLYPDEEETLKRIEEDAEIAERKFSQFRLQQTSFGGQITTNNKDELRSSLEKLRTELDRYLAQGFGVREENSAQIEKWRATHRPFHWLVEFYGIIKRGGFDAIIGNPPYVEYKKVIGNYSLKGYESLECGNLYAFVLERSLQIAHRDAQLGLIVPISLTAAQRMAPLQQLLFDRTSFLWLSNFALRPAALFPGVMQRLTIALGKKGNGCSAHTTDYITWYAEERETLFANLSYCSLNGLRQAYSVPKFGNTVGRSAINRILENKRPWHHHRQFQGATSLYYHNAGGYWIKTFDFRPYYRSLTDPGKRHTTISELCLPAPELATTYLGVLNSSTFYFFWKSLTDARHVYPSDIAMFPIELPLDSSALEQLADVTAEFMVSLRKSCARITYGKAEVDQFKVGPSKPIIDKIDRILATHYGFTDDELDFIVNYDIKYRMGLNAVEDLESEEDEDQDEH